MIRFGKGGVLMWIGSRIMYESGEDEMMRGCDEVMIDCYSYMCCIYGMLNRDATFPSGPSLK